MHENLNPTEITNNTVCKVDYVMHVMSNACDE